MSDQIFMICLAMNYGLVSKEKGMKDIADLINPANSILIQEMERKIKK